MSSQQQQHSLCMIPGPVEFHEDVLSEMASPATSHIDPHFISQFSASLSLLRHVFLAAPSAQPFVVAGSGTLGWDMVASNLVEQDERVVVVNTGLFGDRFAECLEVYGANVTHVRAGEIGAAPSLDNIRQALAGGKTKMLTVTHVDTSTSVLTDIKAIAELVHQVSPDTLVTVDGVCSVGGEEIRMQEWGIDVVLTASQKALGAPPGLAILVASERAMNVFKSRKTRVPNYYASWQKWLPIMAAYEEKRAAYFATPPVQLIKALYVSLKQILNTQDAASVTAAAANQAMTARFAEHVKCSDAIKKELQGWGLKLVSTAGCQAHTLTAAYYPNNIAPTQLLPKIVARGVTIAGGLHPEIATKYFRVGHMGLSVMEESQRGYVARTTQALKEALGECGFNAKV
ncbi:hypothetical protein RI367_005076 [Sorochytrium milnesiophthora]